MHRSILNFVSVFFVFQFGLEAFAKSSPRSTPINFPEKVILAEHVGDTFLHTMRETVKPSLDRLATEGYVMCSPETVAEAFENVDRKVLNQLKRAAKSLDKVLEIAGQIEGKTVTLHSLPKEIAKVSRDVDRFKLATFFGLACGGGVAIEFAEGNTGLNVHYDVSENRSGRSFGVGPTRKANDASDKNYLQDLQEYLSEYSENSSYFVANLLAVLLASDSSDYLSVEAEGQNVLTDFLSVFTAEQARNLMDGHVTPHWDAALLEVTLLSLFHAGQDEFSLYYKNPETEEVVFTNQTLKQARCALPTVVQVASMVDYWQFSRQYDNPEHCGRSGINITKSEFRLLGKKLTSYLKEFHPKVIAKISSGLGLKNSANVFQSLSKFLINDELPSRLSKDQITKIKTGFVEALEILRREANEISKNL